LQGYPDLKEITFMTMMGINKHWEMAGIIAIVQRSQDDKYFKHKNLEQKI